MKVPNTIAQIAYRKKFSNKLPKFTKDVKEIPIFLPEDEHPYGRPNRPSTSVGDVISNYYGRIAE